MRLIGRYKEKHIIDDELVASFILDDYRANLDELKDQKIVIEIKKYHEKRSLSANAYFWSLVGQIASALGTDPQSIYIWMLRDGGVSTTMTVLEDALPTLRKFFRLVEEIGRSNGYIDVICYYGSSQYDSKEMAHLIDITRQEATKLGIDVWTDEEIRRLFNDNTANDNKETS